MAASEADEAAAALGAIPGADENRLCAALIARLDALSRMQDAVARDAAAGEWSVRRLEEEARRRSKEKKAPEKEGYDYAAMATFTGLSEQQVGVYLFRARKTLKKLLEDYR